MKIPFINYKKKYKLGDEIYPYYNGTAVWYKTNIYGVVYKVSKKGSLDGVRWFYCRDCANIYSELIKNKLIKGEI